MTTATKSKFKSRKASRMIGDTERILTAGAKSTDGKFYPAGTKFQPLCGGSLNGRNYGTVTIANEQVSFYM